MTRTLAALACLPLALVACSSFHGVGPSPSSALATGTEGPHATRTNEPGQVVSSLAHTPLRSPGDFVVFRFTGKLEKHPLTLTERLVAVQDDSTVIDYTLEEGSSKQTMRVRSVGAGGEQKVVSAALMDGEVEGPVSTKAFDAFLARTVIVPEINGGASSADRTSIDVNGRALDCTRTTYEVTLGKKRATMTVLESDGFAWGDVGGEIRGADGTVLYKAELVSQGTVEGEAVAQRTP